MTPCWIEEQQRARLSGSTRRQWCWSSLFCRLFSVSSLQKSLQLVSFHSRQLPVLPGLRMLMVMGDHGLVAPCPFCDNDCKSCANFKDFKSSAGARPGTVTCCAIGQQSTQKASFMSEWAWDCIRLWTNLAVPSFHREWSLSGCSSWAGTCTRSGTLQWSQCYHGSFLPVYGNKQLQTAPGWPPRNSENLWWATLPSNLFTMSLSSVSMLHKQETCKMLVAGGLGFLL